MKITIRKAEQKDSKYIAENILAAMSLPAYTEEIAQSPDKEYDLLILNKMIEVVEREDSLYSYKNTTIALYEGKIAGSMTAYKGEFYAEMRKVTFDLFAKVSKHNKEAEESDFETADGEYYLDAMAVRPEFRGKGIAKTLMMNEIENAKRLNLKASLIVDIKKPHTQKMYEALGFSTKSQIKFFGEIYNKMLID